MKGTGRPIGQDIAFPFQLSTHNSAINRGKDPFDAFDEAGTFEKNQATGDAQAVDMMTGLGRFLPSVRDWCTVFGVLYVKKGIVFLSSILVFCNRLIHINCSHFIQILALFQFCIALVVPGFFQDLLLEALLERQARALSAASCTSVMGVMEALGVSITWVHGSLGSILRWGVTETQSAAGLWQCWWQSAETHVVHWCNAGDIISS